MAYFLQKKHSITTTTTVHKLEIRTSKKMHDAKNVRNLKAKLLIFSLLPGQ